MTSKPKRSRRATQCGQPKPTPRKLRPSTKKIRTSIEEVVVELSGEDEGEEAGASASGGALTKSGGPLTTSPSKEIVQIQTITQTVSFKGSVGAAQRLGYKSGVMQISM